VPINTAYKMAKGKYIAYQNQDDLWLPNHLQCLIEKINKSSSEIVYSILEIIMPDGRKEVHIPQYPYAPTPPENISTLHKKELIEEMGDWKHPDEIKSTPRCEFFRRAEFSGKQFELTENLTALKFQGFWPVSGKSEGPLFEYVGKIKNDPDFIAKELAALLIHSDKIVNSTLSITEFFKKIMQSLRYWCIKNKIDPNNLKWWEKKGSFIKKWRKWQKFDKNRM